MTEERKEAWRKVFTVFASVWPSLRFTPELVIAWDAALEDLSPDELSSGALDLLRTWSMAMPPPPGALRDAVRGRLVSVPVVYQDPFGSVVLKGGAPVIMGNVRVRVKEGQPRPRWLTMSEAKAAGLLLGPATPKALRA